MFKTRFYSAIFPNAHCPPIAISPPPLQFVANLISNSKLQATTNHQILIINNDSELQMQLLGPNNLQVVIASQFSIGFSRYKPNF
jgi:hypothetical protein